MRTTWFAVAAIAALSTHAIHSSCTMAAPLSYAGGTYFQDFDGLPLTGSETLTGKGPHQFDSLSLTTSGMAGWQLANPAGSSGNTEFRAHDGSLAGGSGRGVVSFGANDSADRALGALPTGNQISTFGLVLQNDTSGTLTEFTLSYTGEQWRRGDIEQPAVLTFAYGLASGIDGVLSDVVELSFASPNTQVAPTELALDGNLLANQAMISHTVDGLNWAPGESLVLRWSISEVSGQDDGLAIDNLSFTAVPEPGAAVLALLAASAVAITAYRRRTAVRASC